jgi:hypothetical protein
VATIAEADGRVRTPTAKGQRFADEAVSWNDAVREQSENLDLSLYRRRYALRLANDHGMTYAALSQLTGMAVSVVGEQIAKARAEVEAGQGTEAKWLAARRRKVNGR